jgi:hypothetical protein
MSALQSTGNVVEGSAFANSPVRSRIRREAFGGPEESAEATADRAAGSQPITASS